MLFNLPCDIRVFRGSDYESFRLGAIERYIVALTHPVHGMF